MTNDLNYSDLARDLSNAIGRSYPDWSRLHIWQAEGSYDGVSHAHRLLSSILHVIGDAPVEWVVADVDTGDRSEPSITYTLTLWTADMVIRATRAAGDRWPIVSPSPRSHLREFDLLKSQVVTITVYGSPERGVTLRLSYPRFNVEVEDPREVWLPAAIPSLLADLQARPQEG